GQWEVGRSGDGGGGAHGGLLAADAVLHEGRVRELRDDRAVLGKRCARLAGTAEEADETQDRAAGVLGEPLLVRQVLDGLENGLGRASQFVERLCAGGGGRGQA